MPEPISDMNRNQEVGYFGDFYGNEEPLDINVRNLENLSLMDNFSSVSTLAGAENNENLAYFQDNFDAACAAPFLDDPKEGNISKTVRVPSSEHVAEIVGRQGCKIKDLRARTNTYIKTPMRTQSPVFVVTGKEEAVLHVMEEINSAAEHFTHIRASRNHHKAGGGLESAKPVSREGDIVQYVTVPYRVVGLVVGLKGQTIKAIQQDTDTFIVTPNRDKAPIFEIRGQPENVERAKMMILRHIETRTRHCRLQDTTNLPSNWNDEQRFTNGNDYPYYHGDVSSQMGPGSNSGLPSVSNNFNGNSGMLSGTPMPSQQGPGFSNTFSASSPTSSSSYNSWRGFNSLLDQHPQQAAGHMATWSNATSDYPSALGSSSVVSNGSNNPLSSAVRSNNNFQYSISTGSISSPSNSTVSVSPPNDFLNDGTFTNHQLPSPYGGAAPMNNPFLKRMSEPSAADSPFSSFPLLTTAPSTSTKGSLVLGNLFQPNNNVTSALGIGLMSSSNNVLSNSALNGFQSPGSDEPNATNLPALGGGVSFRRGMTSTAPGEVSVFPGPMGVEMNRFPSGESSPTSKMSDTSGSQGSPVPRVCKVCEEAEVVAALVPCGHNLFCMECAEGIVNKASEDDRTCPVCKDPAADVLRIRA
ncbi:RNA-binding protein MEX3B [Aplysia californica]|uniref:RNA-binding protein MEX3B n=1 Tax=Aplysia californica TaxID=6500 RepID=A0ABM0JEY2_APLCA|nr:RNA-binding protein MEX3B [Aplysia californica]